MFPASTRRTSVAGAVAIALGIGMIPAVWAQQQVIEEIVVTGSYIRGTPEDAALPVDVISLSDLRDRGSPSALDLIKSLPTVGPVLGDTNQFASGAQGTIGTGNINLRGLGGLRTLVLLNGRRTTITPAEGPGGVDTNMLPLAAVGRVEILKDGAAAIYGSDAIGGVVNFITRSDLDGLEVAADYRAIDGSDGDYTMSVNWGWRGQASDVLLSIGHQHRSELSATKRKWPNQSYTTNPAGWSVLGQPGVFLPRAGAAPVAGVTRDANCEAVGGFAGFAGATPTCYFTYIPFDNLVEETNRFQVFSQINAELAPNVNFHVEALYAKTEIPDIRFSPGYPPTSGPNGPGSVNVFGVTSLGPTPFANNPGALTALQQAGLAAGTIAATDNVLMTLWRPLGAGGNAATGGLGGQSGWREYDLKRFSTGINGQFANAIGWDVALTYSDSRHHRMTTDIQINRLRNALNGLGGANCNGIPFGSPGSTCQFFNPFSNAYAGNPALGLTNPGFVSSNQNDPELIAWLFDSPVNTQRQDLAVVDAVLNGPTIGIELPHGTIGWAVGAQYRRVHYESRTSSDLSDLRITPCPIPGDTTCAFRTGPYIFLGQFLPQRLDEKVMAVFGELAIPVLANLDVQLALRHEDYGGLTGSTTNPKAAARWQVTDFLALRGSVGTTFRGPIPLNRAARGITGLSGIAAAGNNFKSVDFFGNPAIQPETAFTYNVGAIVDAAGFRVIADYWSYVFEDQITSVPANIVANAVGNGPGNGTQLVNCDHPLRDLITFNNNNTCTQGVTVGNDIARVRADIANGPELKTSGVDLSITRAQEVFNGTLSFGFDASYVLEYKLDDFIYQGTFVSAGYDAVGFTNYDRFPGTISDWRGTLHFNFNRGPANVRYEVTYVDGVKDNRPPINVQQGVNSSTPGALVPITFGHKVDAFYSNNLYVNYELPWETTVSLAIVNLLDRDPSKARLELSYDPFIGNPLGRTIQLGVRKTMGGR
jgi:iron complex outermembrane recepter protein